jgi:hypothetical protein
MILYTDIGYSKKKAREDGGKRILRLVQVFSFLIRG